MYPIKKTFGQLRAMDVGLGSVTNDAQLKRASGDLNSFPSETITDDDVLVFEDASDNFAKKKAKKQDIATSKAEAIKNVLIYS